MEAVAGVLFALLLNRTLKCQGENALSLMDITCGDCGARFRLDRALLKDANAARIRCRKCGGRIVVRLPEEPPIPAPPAPMESEVASPEKSAPWQEEPALPPPVEEASPKEPTAFDADISGMFRSEPVSSPVLPPQETSPPPAEEPPEPEKPPEKSAPWLEEAALPPPVKVASSKEPMAPEADISDVIRSEPVPSPPVEKTIHPDNIWNDPEPETALPGTDAWRQEAHDPGSADPVPSGMPGTVYSRLEDLFAVPTGEDAGPDTVPPEENPPEETAATEPGRKAPSRPALFTLKILVISVLWILLLAGGALYFGTMKSGQGLLGKLFAGWGSGRTGGAPARPVYDIRDVKWHVDKESAAGNLFVIRGSVANVGNVPSTGIRIHATLLGKDNEALAEKAAFAGNLLDEASLRRADRAGIEGVLSNRFGDGNVNRNIPAGNALPFMIVFTDPPEEIASFIVGAFDGE